MKTHLLTIAVMLFSISTFAQPNRERIKALKVAHITTTLNLSEEEAQQFWPIYNAYDKKSSKIKHGDLREMRREIRQGAESLSEKEANDLLARFIEAENKMHLERTQLVEKLRAVIPAKKIILLKVAEEEFNRKILEQMKNFRDRRQKNKP